LIVYLPRTFRRCARTAIPVAVWCGVLLLIASACSKPPQPEATAPTPPPASDIVRVDAALDELIPAGAKLEKLATGFKFVEGPLWFSSGHLWFSDVVGNVVRQWSPDGKVIEILQQGGSMEGNGASGPLVGPNGMTHDKNGAVLLCQHGNRRIVRISPDQHVSVAVDRFQGKRFNSPNDLVFRSDGSLYFTDPPYGLDKQDEDPKKELKFNGVFRLSGGKLAVVLKDLSRPNGIAFSPDQKSLYVSNSEEKHKVWMAYDVSADGAATNGRVFFDVTGESAPGLPDGMKVDSRGNLYCSGPGGIWIFSASGKHLGTIKTPEIAANCNWGDDGKSLYITASTSLYRLKLAVEGEQALYN